MIAICRRTQQFPQSLSHRPICYNFSWIEDPECVLFEERDPQQETKYKAVYLKKIGVSRLV
jgi:hypothetical protein